MNIHATYERAAPDTNKTSRIIPHGAMTVLWENKTDAKLQNKGFHRQVIGSQPKGSSNAFSQVGVDATGGNAFHDGGRNSAVKHPPLTADAL